MRHPRRPRAGSRRRTGILIPISSPGVLGEEVRPKDSRRTRRIGGKLPPAPEEIVARPHAPTRHSREGGNPLCRVLSTQSNRPPSMDSPLPGNDDQKELRRSHPTPSPQRKRGPQVAIGTPAARDASLRWHDGLGGNRPVEILDHKSSIGRNLLCAVIGRSYVRSAAKSNDTSLATHRIIARSRSVPGKATASQSAVSPPSTSKLVWPQRIRACTILVLSGGVGSRTELR